MKARWLFGLALIGTLAQAQNQITSQSFAWHTRIETDGSGPFYQAVLPLSVYQGVQRGDLGDVRVFNAAGEVVPHAWLQTRPTAVSEIAESAVTVFPLQSSATAAGQFSVDVHRNGDDTLVAVRQAEPTVKTSPAGAVIDISKLNRQVHLLRLMLAPSAQPFHHFSLDTSDDLQNWRSLVGDAQIVRLERDGQRIENNRIEWNGESGKYLRILWRDPQQAPEISSATVGVTHTAVNPAPMLWSASLLPVTIRKDLYEYRLPGRLPLEQLRIELDQPNTLVPIELQRYQPGYGRQREQGRWDPLATTIAYRLASPQGEERSPALQLNLPAEDRLRLQVDSRSGGVGATAPRLQVGFTPQILVFLARGNGPFTLGWGAPQVASSALPIATLVPAFDNDKKLAAAVARIAPIEIANVPLAAVAATGVKSKGVLWAVLLAGVAILGGMAWMLIRQMKTAPPSPQDE